jgi:aryl-alcohol dehydrogenase-like predicted oxidoreductase
MESRPLGKTGLRVSPLSFGCVELGLPYGIGVHSPADMLSADQAVELLQTALARGITAYDTAPAYGASEQLLGRAFTGRRQQVVLCTKCPALTGDDGRVLRKRVLRDRLFASLDASLQALRTDYVDILMLHRVDEIVIANDEVAELFEDLKSQRAIRASGASMYPGGSTGRVIESRRWDVIQIALSLIDQRETAFLEAAVAAGIGVMARSVLCKGILTERGRALHLELQSIQAQRQRCAAAAPEGMALAEFATRYALSLPGVSTVLVGIDRPDYLEQALAMAVAGPLSPEHLVEAADLAFPDPEFIDLPAWHARGWLT